MAFIWITELGLDNVRLNVTSALPFTALARFSSPRFQSLSPQCHSIHPILLSPLSLIPPMLRPKKIPPAGSPSASVALYHDVGYGLRKAASQQYRKFRLPVIYSNPRVD